MSIAIKNFKKKKKKKEEGTGLVGRVTAQLQNTHIKSRVQLGLINELNSSCARCPAWRIKCYWKIEFVHMLNITCLPLSADFSMTISFSERSVCGLAGRSEVTQSASSSSREVISILMSHS